MPKSLLLLMAACMLAGCTEYNGPRSDVERQQLERRLRDIPAGRNVYQASTGRLRRRTRKWADRPEKKPHSNNEDSPAIQETITEESGAISSSIQVLGAVHHPGGFSFKPGMTLTEAIRAANTDSKGVHQANPDARYDQVYIITPNSNQPPRHINAVDLMKGKGRDEVLTAGQVIFVFSRTSASINSRFKKLKGQ